MMNTKKFLCKGIAIQKLYSALRDGEMGLRGKDDLVLYPVNQLIEDVRRETEILYYLSKEDSVQKKKIEKIRSLINEKKSILQLLSLSVLTQSSIYNNLYNNLFYTTEIQNLLLEIQHTEINQINSLSKSWKTEFLILLKKQ